MTPVKKSNITNAFKVSEVAAKQSSFNRLKVLTL